MNGKGGKFAIGALAGMAVLVLAAAVSFAHGGRHGGEGAGREGLYSGKALDRLGVSAEQKAQIRDVLGKYRPETEPAVRQLAAERRALRRQLHPRLEELMEKGRSEIRAGLRPDQQARFDEIVSERRHRRRR